METVAGDCRVLDVENHPQVTESLVDIETRAVLDCPVSSSSHLARPVRPTVYKSAIIALFISSRVVWRITAVKESEKRPTGHLVEIIRDESVSFIIASSSKLAHWLRYGKTKLKQPELMGAASLKSDFSGREALPSEVSAWCTTANVDYSVEEDKGVAIPIGRPIENCGVVVVDKGLKPVPSGASGEIAVTGAGVANG
ncbi:hypothetical protein HBI25_219170 [Parastagonospora nodorum]|nr:hypothetical protein HBH52_231440 [Parastagonospora nodorum]KAH3992018.1 hypothetical protein HBI10_223380 [Parastagonospora nodorum]KAH4009865.1 hypothetical protein HBI13_216060 [Parastagonospora nodorum]KAH4016859.1 hypothetical protein HBI09_201090 [Parastagonospora nodorum]KAH4043708.1 hypothetical protein HBH49_230240 [Parastagonospora nodorum]